MDENILSVTRVLIVDDHPIIQQGLTHLINQEDDMRVCGAAANVKSAVKQIEAHRPRVVIVDLSLPGDSGLRLIRYICQQWVDVRPIVVSSYDAAIYAMLARHEGAMAYICKQDAAEEVVAAIRTVLNGQHYLSRTASIESALWAR
ncbi:MAG: response regulator transcription factor [Phycisphaeraceae bacterium]|nr:response regulator transcription factor [Phycisphaeraceae bacterium]